ncbi:hypothetical protein GTO89_07615 [Heliobacterium gestii]|uniref:Tetratricopeptide repeat protein n=1 Tax=Heliomicrobium gestii TaxID=2699 RepID=A0A845LEN3_HELGE|nr:hypothetical protein [Heliomicrobium gestii]MBM7866305.1 tetratricopeptide (TPR) repeat protein [Heliomicrobium gestii]MZP42905.1 hypothetical protein [Heliomicrobium gestii]
MSYISYLKQACRKNESRHKLFSTAFELIKDDPKAVHEFATTKLKLAKNTNDGFAKRKLNQEAVELLHRAIQLAEDDTRRAWCWFDLAKSLHSLRKPETEILQAYQKAIEILPFEKKFTDWFKSRKKQKPFS